MGRHRRRDWETGYNAFAGRCGNFRPPKSQQGQVDADIAAALVTFQRSLEDVRPALQRFLVQLVEGFEAMNVSMKATSVAVTKEMSATLFAASAVQGRHAAKTLNAYAARSFRSRSAIAAERERHAHEPRLPPARNIPTARLVPPTSPRHVPWATWWWT